MAEYNQVESSADTLERLLANVVDNASDYRAALHGITIDVLRTLASRVCARNGAGASRERELIETRYARERLIAYLVADYTSTNVAE